MKIKVGFLLVYILIIFSFFVYKKSFAEETISVADHIVISEIKTIGETTTDEFIELYNPTEQDISLFGYSLYKFTANSTSTENKKLLVAFNSSSTIYAYGHFLISHRDSFVNSDIYYVTSTMSVSDNNTILLQNEHGNIVDLVGFGNATAVEGIAAQKPTQQKSIERLPGGIRGNGIDTDNNNNDFIRVLPSPQNTNSEPINSLNHSPTAIFTISSSTTDLFLENTFFVSTTVFFDASDSFDIDEDDITVYKWGFGDGFFGEQGIATTSHIYDSVGDYIVSLEIEDEHGASASTSTVITIIEEYISIIDEEGAVPDILPTSTPKILINECMTNPEDGIEWIEFFNPNSFAVDMLGWKLLDNSKTVILDMTISPLDYAVVTSTNRFNNGGDIVLLRDSYDEMVDRVYYGDYSDEFRTEIEQNAPAPDKGNTIVRKPGFSDTDIYIEDFFETLSPTYNMENIIESPVEEVSVPPGSSGGGSSSQGSRINSGDVLINEFVSDPADDKHEFVELFNTTNQIISLHNFYIEEGSGQKTKINNVSIPANGFLVIESLKGNLNNSGDIIILYDSFGKKIDSISYGNWDDGNIEDNIVVASDPYSVSRNSDNTFFVGSITKGFINIEEDFENIVDYEVEYTQTSSTIILTEIFPNPEGSDSLEEFIEIYNNSKSDQNLDGWKIVDATGKGYIFKDKIIKSGEYFVLYREESGIALNNSGEEVVIIYDKKGESHIFKSYNGAEEGFSYNYNSNGGIWFWNKKITPGKENIAYLPQEFLVQYNKRVLVGELVEFDASGVSAIYNADVVWYFENDKKEGNTVEKAFYDIGNNIFEVGLYKNEDEIARATFEIEVIGEQNEFVGGFVFGDPYNLVINEVFPNPKGSDEVEFVELYNPTELPIDLSGIILDDKEGGSKIYKIKDNQIDPFSFVVLYREETGIVFNNTEDIVRILGENNEIIAQIEYSNVVEGASYSFDKSKGVYSWTNEITPGKENKISLPIQKVAGKKIKKDVSGGSNSGVIVETTLENLSQHDVGDMIRVRGIVAVLPDIFSSQYFYITGSPGIQVYSYKKDFPDLSIGDEIEVVGELSKISGELRIKTKSIADIKKTGIIQELEPHQLEVASIEGMESGWFVTFTGEVTEAKSTQMYVDDGTDEVRVYFKKGTGINGKNFSEGDIVNVSGIVVFSKSGYRVFPRMLDDIVILEKFVEEKDEDSVVIEEGNKEKQFFFFSIEYLFISIIGLVLFSFAFMFKRKK
jgi:hypothetical protein